MKSTILLLALASATAAEKPLKLMLITGVLKPHQDIKPAAGYARSLK